MVTMAAWVTLKTNVTHQPNTEDDIIKEANSIDLGTVDVHINFELVTDWYEFNGVIHIMQMGELEYKTFKGTTTDVKAQILKNTITNLFKAS
jgi:hypothetical protein